MQVRSLQALACLQAFKTVGAAEQDELLREMQLYRDEERASEKRGKLQEACGRPVSIVSEKTFIVHLKISDWRLSVGDQVRVIHDSASVALRYKHRQWVCPRSDVDHVLDEADEVCELLRLRAPEFFNK